MTNTLTEVGAPWYDNAAIGEQVDNPHGVATDLNGNVYIGEGNTGDIRKFNCDGTLLPESEFVIMDGGFNFASVGNTLYTNGLGTEIDAYDLCTGNYINQVCLDDAANSEDWGFYYDETTETFYSTAAAFGDSGSAEFEGDLWTYTANDFGSGNCISPLISANDGVVNIGDAELPHGNLRGVTTDQMGNIYIVFSDRYGNITGTVRSAKLVKFSLTGQFISENAWDTVDGDGGYFFGQSIVYSATTNSLFVATGSTVEDCVAQFDLDLNYLGVAVPPAAAQDTEAKAMGIITECCPDPAVQFISESVCNATLPYSTNINELFPCSGGVVCEAPWELDAANTDATVSFNDCEQSIDITSLGCATFTKASAGDQCGAFNVTFEICLSNDSPTPPAISIVNNTCNPDVAGSINVDTPCAIGTIEYSTDGGTNWSATPPAYDAVNPITVTVHRVE